MSKHPKNSEDSIKDQLGSKYEELCVIAATCGLNEKDVRNDIADSMEEANKLIKSLDSLDDSYCWWADWWYNFLMEWVGRCFIKYVDKSGALHPYGLYSDYGRMRDLWVSEFEPLWMVGCDIARLTRMNLMTQSMAKFISNRTEGHDENRQESIWEWVNGFNEIALEIFDLFKQRQRKIFDSSLEWLKDYNKDYISAELRRLLSN